MSGLRALVCSRLGRFRDLAIEEIASPPLGADGVRIAVSYASLSYAINLMVAGQYQQKSVLPFIPGKELSGVVTEVATGVSGIAPGDRVVAIVDSGAFAQEVVAKPGKVFVLPPDVPLRTALPLPISYGSAYAALRWRARLQPGETLLVHGATGGIGLAAVQIGRHCGARVIAAASTEAKRRFLESQGVEAVVPSTGFRDTVRARTNGRGADVVFDPVGGVSFDESLRCVAPEGRILMMGFASGAVPSIPANLLLVKDVTVMGFHFGRYTGGGAIDESAVHAPRLRAMMDDLFRWTAAGHLRPVVNACFPLDRYVEAMDTLIERTVPGKVALRIGTAD
jgi:NADPH2:quinone reductase